MGKLAIISEFNPFHNGHDFLLQKAKELFPHDELIVLMSGNAVQRGEIAIQDKYARAKNAILGGADLVLELPSVFAVSNAEGFSRGAISLIDKLSCDKILFGSEIGDIEKLKNASLTLSCESESFKDSLKKSLKNGELFAKARENALEDKQTAEILLGKNNILGIEYLKAIAKIQSSIVPFTVKRFEGDNFMSASEIRKNILQRASVNFEKYLPTFSKESLDFSLDEKTLLARYFSVLKMKLLSMTEEELAEISEVTEGLENRILKALESETDYLHFISCVKTKRYTMAKIKRTLLNSVVGKTKEIEKKAFKNLNYVKALAVKNDKKHLLSSYDNFITTTKDFQKVDQNNIQFLQIDKRTDDLFNTIYELPTSRTQFHRMITI